MDAIRNRQIHGDFGLSIIRDANYISDGRNARLTAPDGHHANRQQERNSSDHIAAFRRLLVRSVSCWSTGPRILLSGLTGISIGAEAVASAGWTAQRRT